MGQNFDGMALMYNENDFETFKILSGTKNKKFDVGGIIGDNFERDTNFIKLHVMVIFNRKDYIKIKDKV